MSECAQRCDAKCCKSCRQTKALNEFHVARNNALGMYEKRQRPAGLRLQPYEDYLENTPVNRVARNAFQN
jgi:hypothetical protein